MLAPWAGQFCKLHIGDSFKLTVDPWTTEINRILLVCLPVPHKEFFIFRTLVHTDVVGDNVPADWRLAVRTGHVFVCHLILVD